MDQDRRTAPRVTRPRIGVHPRFQRFFCAMLLLGLFAPPVGAVSVADYPALGEFVDSMVERHGFDREALRRLFANASLQPQVIAAMERPREALPWHSYRRGFVTQERVELGVRYWRDHRATLARAQRIYGVPPELIVAIIGVESRYGAHQGSQSVLDALLTLTLEFPRRADFFRNELEEFLLLARELGLDPSGVKGSYAGALGIPQFISSSYRHYAVDFDGDQQRDLFASSADAIGSVANFLSQHGWAEGQPVIDPARVAHPRDTPAEEPGMEPAVTVEEWTEHGVFPRPPRRGGKPAHRDGRQAASLITLEGESGPLYHLGYKNFYVITRYNRSQNYAMAVYELARMIRQRYRQES